MQTSFTWETPTGRINWRNSYNDTRKMKIARRSRDFDELHKEVFNLYFFSKRTFGFKVKDKSKCRLNLSWRRPITNQMLCKSMDWFLYDIGLRHERVIIISIDSLHAPIILLLFPIFIGDNYFFRLVLQYSKWSKNQSQYEFY